MKNKYEVIIDLTNIGGGQISRLEDWAEKHNGPIKAYHHWLTANPDKPHQANFSADGLAIKVLEVTTA